MSNVAEITGFVRGATKVFVDPVVDAASGTFVVRQKLPNASYKTPAGLNCKVVFRPLEP